MTKPFFLQTQRLSLQQLQPSDHSAVAQILQDSRVMYAWEHTFSAAEVAAWLEENLRRYARDGYSFWAVRQLDDPQLVGVCGLLNEQVEEETYLGLGYLFHYDFWHRGLALEAAAACRDYAFAELQASLLTAQIRPENQPSRSLAEKLGMQPRRQFDRIYRGKTMPHLLYALENPVLAAKK